MKSESGFSLAIGSQPFVICFFRIGGLSWQLQDVHVIIANAQHDKVLRPLFDKFINNPNVAREESTSTFLFRPTVLVKQVGR